MVGTPTSRNTCFDLMSLRYLHCINWHTVTVDNSNISYKINISAPILNFQYLKKHHPFLMTEDAVWLPGSPFFGSHKKIQGYKCQPWCSSTLAFNLGLMRHCPCWRINVFTFRGILQCHAQCIGTWHLGRSLRVLERWGCLTLSSPEWVRPFFPVRSVGSVGSIHPIGNIIPLIFTTYSPCLLEGYMLPSTY